MNGQMTLLCIRGLRQTVINLFLLQLCGDSANGAPVHVEGDASVELVHRQLRQHASSILMYHIKTQLCGKTKQEAILVKCSPHHEAVNKLSQ